VLEQILSVNIFVFFMVFVRLGGAMTLMPGFGENIISPRVRLAISFSVALALFPVVGNLVPAMPESSVALLGLIVMEFVIGLLIGASARILMSTLHVAGTVISFQSSLGMAQTVDPTAGNQGAVIVGLLNIVGLVMIFALGLHHTMLKAVVNSYVIFPPGTAPPINDFTELAVGFVQQSFTLGFQIATPFVVYGLIFYICLGLMTRLMPKLQLFFIALPLQILLSLMILMTVLPIGVLWFLDHFEANLARFMVVG
jgi:flagellar biosynthetic protein FliR